MEEFYNQFPFMQREYSIFQANGAHQLDASVYILSVDHIIKASIKYIYVRV